MKKGIIISTIIILLGSAGAIYSGVMIAEAKMAYTETSEDYEIIEEEVIKFIPKTEEVVVAERTKPAPPFEVDFDELHGINEDVCGWIYIEDTKVNYPILKSTDNQDYLRTTVDGKSAVAGSIFMDELNQRDFQDANTIIYGHNMNDGSMFRVLNSYKEQSFYEEHPNIYIFLENGDYRKYGILSAHVTEAVGDTYLRQFNDMSFKEYLLNEKDLSLYDTGVAINESKPSVVLSTCVKHNSTLRMVLVLQELEDY